MLDESEMEQGRELDEVEMVWFVKEERQRR